MVPGTSIHIDVLGMYAYINHTGTQRGSNSLTSSFFRCCDWAEAKLMQIESEIGIKARTKPFENGGYECVWHAYYVEQFNRPTAFAWSNRVAANEDGVKGWERYIARNCWHAPGNTIVQGSAISCSMAQRECGYDGSPNKMVQLWYSWRSSRNDYLEFEWSRDAMNSSRNLRWDHVWDWHGEKQENDDCEDGEAYPCNSSFE